jgi:hypothetical protein
MLENAEDIRALVGECANPTSRFTAFIGDPTAPVEVGISVLARGGLNAVGDHIWNFCVLDPYSLY